MILFTKQRRLLVLCIVMMFVVVFCTIPADTWVIAWRVRFGDRNTVSQTLLEAYEHRKEQHIQWWAVAPCLRHKDPGIRYLALTLRHDLVPSDPSVKEAFISGMFSEDSEVRRVAMHAPKGVLTNEMTIPYFGGLLFFAEDTNVRLGALVELEDLASSDDRALNILRKAGNELKGQEPYSAIRLTIERLDKKRNCREGGVKNIEVRHWDTGTDG